MAFKKERHDPIKLIAQFWPKADVNHITYDPKMRTGDYDIVRQSGGDGTLQFTIEMLEEGLINIVNMNSTCKHTEPKEWEKVKAIKYTVGPMRHVTVYGMIKLRCSSDKLHQGQRERIRMPVKCEYILDNSN